MACHVGRIITRHQDSAEEDLKATCLAQPLAAIGRMLVEIPDLLYPKWVFLRWTEGLQ
jgi:hypothetical protein